MWDLIFNNYIVFLLVFTRMTSMLLLNPILGKKNVPGIIKMGLAMTTSIVITATLGDVSVKIFGIFDLLLAFVKEVLIGFAASFVIQLFLSVVVMAGELIDLQLGVGMSKIYDPQSNVSMPLTGTIYNLMYILLFFCANGHLTLIRILATSFQILPPGPEILNMQFGNLIAMMFADILVLSLKIAIPILAIELLSEAGLGILMRTVPQINVFVVGLQLKLLIGLVVIVVVMPNVASVLDTSMTFMFDNIEKALAQMA